MKIEIVKNELVIRMPVAKNPPLSKSGKSLLVASTGGFVAGGMFNGKPLRIAVNATVAP